MCKYCEGFKKAFDFDKRLTASENICDSEYEYCTIVKSEDEERYYIELGGTYETLSDEISFCPFCGRKLK
jgi:hypothetical protein